MAEKKGYTAVSRYLRGSAYKIRPVADVVRMRKYPEAMAILENMPQKGAALIKKVIKSAASNALSQNKKLDEDMLYVKELWIDDGPKMRRVWFRARGRADMLTKRLCHITATVEEIGKAGEQGGK
jgi:large subunit ribosomal protein L22